MIRNINNKLFMDWDKFHELLTATLLVCEHYIQDKPPPPHTFKHVNELIIKRNACVLPVPPDYVVLKSR